MMAGPRLRFLPPAAPTGLIGMLLLVVAVESSLAGRHLAFTEAAAASWRYARQKAGSASKDAEILCFGSSLIKFGLVPAQIEKHTGRRTLNLGLYSGRMAASYYLLRRALDSGARPAAVIVDNSLDIRTAEAMPKQNEVLDFNRRNWPELIGPSEAFDLAWNAGDADFLAGMLLARTLYSYRARHEIRTMITKRLDGASYAPDTQTLYLLRNWNANQGTQILPSKAAAADDGVDGPVADVAPVREGMVTNRLSEDYTRRFLDLAASRGIQVFLVSPPIRSDSQSTQNKSGLTTYATGFERELLVRYANLRIVSGRAAGYPRGVFVDTVHLSQDGAIAFSDDLGAIVAAGLGDKTTSAERLTALPPFRRRTEKGPVESFEESVLALSRTRAVR